MDSNLHVFVGPQDDGRVTTFMDLVDGSQFSSAIKCTAGAQNLIITAGRVIGGRDACLDINNLTKNVRVSISEAEATGQFVATIKGESEDPFVTAHVVNHGKICDFILGDWSDQRRGFVKRPVLNATAKTGPVTVIWLASDKPFLFPGSGPYRFKYWPRWTPLWLHALIVYGFQTLRRWGLFRAQSNA